MAAAREPHRLALGGDAHLLEQIADGLRVGERGLQQDFGHEADDIDLPGLERRDGDGHEGPRILRVADLPVDGFADAELTELAVQLIAERADRALRGGEIAQDTRQHREVGDLLRRQVGHVEVETEMQHAVGLRVGTDDRHAVQRDDFAGGHRSLHGHILDGQQRQLRDVLRAVRRRLVLLEGAAGREHLVQLILGPGGLDLRELGLLRLAARGAKGRGRQHRQFGVVRVLQHGRAEQPLKPARSQLRAEGGEAARVAEGVRRITTIEPLIVGVGEERESTRRAAVVLFAVMEFRLVDQCRETGVVEPLRNDVLQRLADGAADSLDVLGLHVLDDQGEQELSMGTDAEADILAESPLEQRLLQRRVVVARERVGDDIHRHVLLALVEAAEDPGVGHQDLALGVLIRADLVLDRLRRRNRLLDHHRRIHLGARVGGKEAVQLRKHGRQVDLAVEEDPGVRRMIEAVVEGLVLLEGQFGDRLRVTAGDEAVAGVGEEQAARLVIEQALGIGEGALHLAVDDAVALQLAIGLVQFVVPALLLERKRTLHAERMEDGIHIDVDEIEEVRRIARTDGVHRRVGACPGVEERRKRALEQVDERLLHGILLGSAEHGMLDDVGHARVIVGQRAEPDRERLVVVVAFEPGEIGAVLRVLHPDETPLHFRKIRHALHGEAAHHVPRLERGNDKRNGCGNNHRHVETFPVHCYSPISERG